VLTIVFGENPPVFSKSAGAPGAGMQRPPYPMAGQGATPPYPTTGEICLLTKDILGQTSELHREKKK